MGIINTVVMNWIDIKDRLPKTEYEETRSWRGSCYFSKIIYVKQGKRKIRAWYKPSNGKFYSVAGANEIVNVTHWTEIQ